MYAHGSQAEMMYASTTKSRRPKQAMSSSRDRGYARIEELKIDQTKLGGAICGSVSIFENTGEHCSVEIKLGPNFSPIVDLKSDGWWVGGALGSKRTQIKLKTRGADLRQNWELGQTGDEYVWWSTRTHKSTGDLILILSRRLQGLGLE